jgi:regulator of replication initiation timing
MGDIGWIKLHRKLIDWEWYKDVNTFKLFIHILLKANIEPKHWQGHLIKRGQILTSIKSLSNETGLTEKQVRTALNKLEKTKEVGKQTTSQNTTLTMINYELYQTDGKQKGTQEANKGQTKGKGGATTKEDKEDKELKEDKEDIVEQFDLFWDLYGKKVDREKCLKKFKSLNDANIEGIFKKVEEYVLSTPDSQFRKNPLTWLNGKCWNDEIIVNTPKVKEPRHIYHYNFVNGGYEKNHFTEAENVEYLKKYPNARLYSKSKHPINDD